MIPEITAAWSALTTATKAISSTLKTIEDVKTKEAIADVQNGLLDLQSKLLAIQAQYEDLAKVKRDLEQKIMEHEKWDAETSRYELKEIASGIFVYVLKPNDAKGEPLHWLCPNCFQNREKSILGKLAIDYANYVCHRCKFEFIPTPRRSPRISVEGAGFGSPDW